MKTARVQDHEFLLLIDGQCPASLDQQRHYRGVSGCDKMCCSKSHASSTTLRTSHRLRNMSRGERRRIRATSIHPQALGRNTTPFAMQKRLVSVSLDSHHLLLLQYQAFLDNCATWQNTHQQGVASSWADMLHLTALVWLGNERDTAALHHFDSLIPFDRFYHFVS